MQTASFHLVTHVSVANADLHLNLDAAGHYQHTQTHVMSLWMHISVLLMHGTRNGLCPKPRALHLCGTAV